MIFNYSIDNESEIFLKKYLNTASPSGYETNGQKLWKNYINPYVDKINVDIYGTVVGIINPNKDYKILIEAHADEISWYVNYITDDGFIYVIPNGGSDHKIAPSKRVYIHTKKGFVKGIFGFPSIHTRKSEEKSDQLSKVNNLFIDIGASSKKEVKDLGVHIGCVISYVDECFILNNKYYVSRALDNKIGSFIIAEVIKLLKYNNIILPFALYVVNAVQEEVGLRGAKMITNVIKPNIAIVTDVAHDTSIPMIEKKIEGDIKCGLGPIINYAPSVHNFLREFVLKIAKENKISYQRLASSPLTYTDNDVIAYSNGGVASVLISIPLRYMHTTVEMVYKKDVEETVKLIYNTIVNINQNQNWNYF
ncbi:MAG: M42 family metallopeptidase [Candidatus Bostrichicola ureolyticus]|nr:MAG: M42 family metallopeptidase [Candidatus Bostrichicola ureolyticus]